MKTELIEQITKTLQEYGYGWISKDDLHKIIVRVQSELVLDAVFQSLPDRDEPAVATPELLGRAAWNAYKKSVGGVAFNGDALPIWEEMSGNETRQKIVAAWKEAARAAVHLYCLSETDKIVTAGYAGIGLNGNIVDRRIHPDAIKIPENSFLGVPKPK